MATPELVTREGHRKHDLTDSDEPKITVNGITRVDRGRGQGGVFMSKVRNGLLTIAALLLAMGVGAGTAHASTPASGATSSGPCKVEFTSLTATSLWHKSTSRDWIWFVIDGNYFPGN